jgi:hypothetical protein
MARAGFIASGIFAAAAACGFGWAFVLISAWVSEHLSLWIGVVGVAKHAVRHFSVSGTVQASQARLIGGIQSAGDVANGYVIDPWRIQLALLPGLLLSVPYAGIETALGLVVAAVRAAVVRAGEPRAADALLRLLAGVGWTDGDLVGARDVCGGAWVDPFCRVER